MDKIDFNNENFVDEYIKMINEMNYDNSFIIKCFKDNLKEGSKVLELGMGPALDYESLKDIYEYTVSDNSDVFIKIFNNINSEKALKLNAVTIETNEKFDCIFTNKVFQCLNSEDIRKSFERQYELLNKNGIVIHTFWLKNNETFDNDSNRLSIEEIGILLNGLFKINKQIIYDEMSQNDSVVIIASKI